MTHSAQEIQDWIINRVSGLTGIPPQDINPQDSFLRYGLDSVAVITLASDLETWLGYRFSANPLEDHPTIASLAAFLAEEVGRTGRA